MKDRRLRAVGMAFAALVLLGAGTFLFYDPDVPVDEVKVYELPDSKPITQHTPRPVQLSAPVSQEMSHVEDSSHEDISPYDRQSLLQEWHALKMKAAMKEKRIAGLEARVAELEAAKAKQEAIVQEAESLRNWVIEEWVPHASAITDEVGYLIPLVDAGLTQQDFMDMFPDLEERDYYATKLIELNEARETLVSKLANASEPVQNEIIKALQNVSSPVLTDEDINELIADIRAKS